MRYFNKITLLCFVLLFAKNSSAKIINLPEDYPSIQEAVENAESGDEIHVNQHGVYFIKDQSDIPGLERNRIRIINKDLVITGTTHLEQTRVLKYEYHSNGHSGLIFYDYQLGKDMPPENNNNLLVIENSNVVFKNLVMTDFPFILYPHFGFPNGTTAAPIQVVSGKLTFDNVTLKGLIKVFADLEIINSTIFGYSYYHNLEIPGTHPIPAIHIRDQNSTNISIKNSEILCGTGEGGRPIVIENVINSNIQIKNTTITTGGHRWFNRENDVTKSYWNFYNFEKGLPGILIVNCSSLELDVNQSVVNGGYGSLSPNSNKRNPSGPGIKVLNSTDITIQGGQSIGQNGLTGRFGYFENRLIHSSDGGNGIDVYNSTVILNNVELIPGSGGSENPEEGALPGKDGIPIYQDENSTVSFVTSITDWSIH